MLPFSAYAILDHKRRGGALTAGEIHEFVQRFMDGTIADYQMTALLMAIAIRGLNDDETAALTRAMLESGEQWKLHERFDFIADKHSTGGVGDKISIVLAPLVAACGVRIAMLSGRGLGHTGGTLDKLHSIPGFNARLSREGIERCVDKVGCAIATSTDDIAPADKRMYALRDVTGTVQSVPLITASIMSKKLAMGPGALILDVKCGRGAFMESIDDARILARNLIAASAGTSTRVEALITDMSAPLGVAVGNANEIRESLATLRNEGPPVIRDLARALAVRILVMSGRFDEEAASRRLDQVLASGEALETAGRWIAAQGGDPTSTLDESRLPAARITLDVTASRSGYVASIDTRAAGLLAIDLGAGRKRHDDAIDPAAGLMFDRSLRDPISAGEVLGRVQIGSKQVDHAEASRRFHDLFEIADEPPKRGPLVIEHVT